MQNLKVKAIALRAVPYKESDLIVTLASVEEGVLTATVKGALKAGAKLRYAASPFNFGDYVLAEGKSGRYTVTECSQIDGFINVVNTLESYYAGAFVLDALSKLLKQPSPNIMVSALKTLGELNAGGDGMDAARDFMLDALRSEGARLNFEVCSSCGCMIEDKAYFHDFEGITCANCARADAIELETATYLYLARGEAIPYASKLKANITLLNILNNLLGVNISARYFTEQL